MSPARIALLLLFLPVALRLPAQQPSAPAPSIQPERAQPIPTLHVTSRLVVLDVVVTDANGNPAHGLKPSDFTLTENGAPQSLASFTEHVAAANAAPASPLPPNTFAVQPPPAEDQTKTIIVLADPTSWSPTADMPEFPSGTVANTGYARNEIASFLKTAPSTQPVAIVRLDWQGMHLVQGLTTDRDTLAEAIASKRMQPPLGFVVRFARGPGSPARQLVRYVNSIPGRINLVWITYGGVLLPGSMQDDFPDLSSLVRDLNGSSNVLHLSRVALYPIPLNQDSVGANAALIAAAKAAGGHAYFTGITQALTEIAATGSDYYTLSYIPTNPDWNGAFRKIKVSVAGFPQPSAAETWSSFWSQALGWTETQKSKVFYRPGYFARTTPSPAEEVVRIVQGSSPSLDPTRKRLSYSPKGDPAGYGAEVATAIQRAMQFGSLPVDHIHFTLTASPYADAIKLKSGAPLPENNFLTLPFRQDAYRNVHIQYRIDQHSLTFARDSLGGYHDSLQFVAVVYRDDGVPVNSIQANEQIQVSANTLATALNSSITFDQTIAIPVSRNPVPGNFFLHVGVAERPSGHIGTLEIPTEWIKLPPSPSIASTSNPAP